MYAPAIFDDRLMTNWLDDLFGKPISAMNRMANPMRTDIVEKDGNYVMTIDMPGFKKEDIKAELKDGILTVSAGSDEVKEEKDETGKVIYSERHTGKYSRSYGVGKHLTEADIKASYENGVLTLEFPTEASKPEEPKRMIAIR
ncbi:MAG: Hsp20/alpha crystallin family protein [Lachnospiraceae bacterium]|nr:Hsp20/alpha crystallin family protein [Lachnospiraceae bacterium]MBR6256440.1 Hsp20/alpha crystallin family protein [Lachnospiraceae bacterium]